MPNKVVNKIIIHIVKQKKDSFQLILANTDKENDNKNIHTFHRIRSRSKRKRQTYRMISSESKFKSFTILRDYVQETLCIKYKKEFNKNYSIFKLITLSFQDENNFCIKSEILLRNDKKSLEDKKLSAEKTQTFTIQNQLDLSLDLNVNISPKAEKELYYILNKKRNTTFILPMTIFSLCFFTAFFFLAIKFTAIINLIPVLCLLGLFTIIIISCIYADYNFHKKRTSYQKTNSFITEAKQNLEKTVVTDDNLDATTNINMQNNVGINDDNDNLGVAKTASADESSDNLTATATASTSTRKRSISN